MGYQPRDTSPGRFNHYKISIGEGDSQAAVALYDLVTASRLRRPSGSGDDGEGAVAPGEMMGDDHHHACPHTEDIRRRLRLCGQD